MGPSFAFRSDYGYVTDNHDDGENDDDNSNSNNNSNKHDNTPNAEEKDLLEILNTSNNINYTATNHSLHQPLEPTQPQPSTNITYEDLVFLRAASEVVKLHESKIDPTIKDVLNRLQYSNSPHGGMPISMEYLKAIDSPDNNIMNNNNINNDLELNNRMSMLSTSEQNLPNYSNTSSHSLSTSISNDDINSNSALSQSYIPPFTENPLRKPPTNLDFPQFSLDIFKNEDQTGSLNPTDKHRTAISKAVNINSNESDDMPRNFKCPECNISFKRSSDLKRHEKIHLKTPPNICSQCHKGFARRDALKRHIGTLTCNRNRMRLLKQLEQNGETLQQ